MDQWFERRGWQLALAVDSSLLLLVAFLAVPYLPMVDLPQHAAQISIWQHLDSPGGAPPFELNLRTPYLGAYVLAHVLAPIVGALAALKLVVWAAVVGQAEAGELLPQAESEASGAMSASPVSSLMVLRLSIT